MNSNRVEQRTIYSVFFAMLLAFFVIPVLALAEDNSKVSPEFAEQNSNLPYFGLCDVYYYGLNGKADYPKALKCFEEQEFLEMIILMRLNGEGTPVDLNKAESLLAEKKENLTEFFIDKLQKAIKERKNNPKAKHQQLEYCADRDTTLDMNYCAYIDDRLAAAKLAAHFVAVKAKLTASEVPVWNSLIIAFENFREAETSRVYYRYIGASWRGFTSSQHSGAVREQFQKLVEKVIEIQNLKTGDEQTYATADKKLNQVYRDDLRQFSEDDTFYGVEAPEQANDDYKKHLKKAQLAWIKYRDLWGELVALLYKDSGKVKHPAISIKTEVTRIRIDELVSAQDLL